MRGGRPGGDDWVALWADSRDATSVYGLKASSLFEFIRRASPAVWIETDPVSPQAPSEKLEMLDLAQRVERVAGWSWPSEPGASRR